MSDLKSSSSASQQTNLRTCQNCQAKVRAGEVFCPECGYVVEPAEHLISWSTAVKSVLLALYGPTIPLLFFFSFMNRETEALSIVFVPFLPMLVTANVSLANGLLGPMFILSALAAILLMPILVWLCRRSGRTLKVVCVCTAFYSLACLVLYGLLIGAGLI